MENPDRQSLAERLSKDRQNVSQNEYASIFEFCTDAILLTIPDGRILAANPSACVMFQMSEQEICEKGREGIVDTTDEQLSDAVKTRSLQGIYTGVLNFVKADGSRFPGELTSRIFTTESGEKRTVIVIRDVSERLEFIKDISDSEKRYRHTLDNMMEGCQIIDFDFRYLYLNNAAIRHSKKPSEELIGKTMFETYPGFDNSDLFRLMKVCMKKREIGRFENTFIFPDNSKGEFELFIEPVPEGLFILSLDITERKKTEKHLKQNQELLRLFAEYAPAAIAMLDNNMHYLASSKRYLSDYGLPDEPIIGKSHYELFPNLPDHWKNIHQRCLHGEILSAEAEPFVRSDGHTDWVSWEIHPWYKPDGKIGGILLFSEVITLRKLAEEKSKADEQKLISAMIETVEMVSKTVEMRDPYTSGHQGRVTTLAVEIAKQLALSPTDIEGIRMSSIVHDLGKISIPAEILSKPGKLTPLEYSFIKTHVQSGYDILKEVDFPWPIAEIVYQHHERLDGSGYPRGLKGDDLLIQSKIICVADVIEAMASHRPYRPSLGIDAALKEITDKRGILFDEKVVDACLEVFKNGFIFEEN